MFHSQQCLVKDKTNRQSRDYSRNPRKQRSLAFIPWANYATVSIRKSTENTRALYHLTTGFNYRFHPCSAPHSPQPRLMAHWSYIKPELLVTPAVYCLARHVYLKKSRGQNEKFTLSVILKKILQINLQFIEQHTGRNLWYTHRASDPYPECF